MVLVAFLHLSFCLRFSIAFNEDKNMTAINKGRFIERVTFPDWRCLPPQTASAIRERAGKLTRTDCIGVPADIHRERPYKVLQVGAFQKNDVNNKTRGVHLKPACALGCRHKYDIKGTGGWRMTPAGSTGYSFPSNLTRIRVAFDVVFSRRRMTGTAHSSCAGSTAGERGSSRQ